MHIWPVPHISLQPLDQIDEPRRVALVASRPAWDVVKSQLRLNVVWQADVQEATLAHWDAWLPQAHGDVVYAVGGGVAADAAKYIAQQLELPLICLPTVLSVDAFLTWASGVRQDGCVRYLETRCPDQLIIDWQVIGAAPPPLRAAGICDLLSIATGAWDWRLAERYGQNPAETAYLPYADRIAQSILQSALDCAEAAGRGDAAGLKQLLDCLVLEVQLCNQIGHARPEEGSEHYFAYAAETLLGRSLPHGDLVGPGILLMAERQGQDVAPLRRALQACHIPLNQIPPDVIRATLSILSAYVRHHHLPYGIAHKLNDLGQTASQSDK